MGEYITFEHHDSVVTSLLRLEAWYIQDGKKPRSPRQIAIDWYLGQKKNGSDRYQQAFTSPEQNSYLINEMEKAITAKQEGKLVSIGDFSQKRDGICEACPVSANNCWRKDDSTSLQEAIMGFRQKR